MRQSEARHLSRVASLGCALCRRLGLGDSPAEIHHLREEQGMAQRGSHWTAIGLCPEHHRGTDGIHGTREAFTNARVDPIDLLADTYEALYG